MADPSLEVCPDFAGDLYAAIRTDLVNATGTTHEAVAERLRDAWTTGHEARILEWNRQREEEAQAEAEIEQARAVREEEERIAREAEAEKDRFDAEKKKPKMNGFNATVTVGDAIAPRPSQYAIQKLNNFEYVELWYFSPDGCKEAMKTSRSIADDTFSLAKLDDQLTIRPASAFKASRSALPDHELPFSIFLRAKNLFLMQANAAKWPQTHLDALALFFWHLENHSIRNNSELGDLVILHYASRVRLDWHDRLKRDEGFNIGIINESLLRSINEEIWDRVRSRTLTASNNAEQTSAQQQHRKTSYRDSSDPKRRPSRSRSPSQTDNHKKADGFPTPDKGKNREQRNKGFSRGAGSRGRSACAICLGHFAHNIQQCDSSNLWDKTTPAHSCRTQDGRIISTNGLPLCYRWQRPGGCTAENHDSAHICSGCGKKDHGAQTCPRGEKA
ncbi:uncharacterized protein HD556DRAFT_446303 [Suillus plorans]|uniref:Uncharacterized protein n=1 Tax=Suillus plorans TaxID=116603 RepID=A0A9P7DI92_9AGAM|nr:uncharacterized protein HD556DRAFT_446303 [Suillus plorans]KAG1793830.1 hypothetical protein HD556DRAFT_446303 [Suillus plorans]